MPRVAVDAVALHFDTPPGGTGPSDVRSLTVRNPGPVDWRWTRLQTTGDHAGDFLPAGPCTESATLPAGASCRIDLHFRPGAPGLRAASLLLAPEGGPAALVSLSGGLPGPARPSLVPLHATATAALVVLPERLVFQAGPATAGRAQAQTLRWRNDGNAVLRIGAFELTAAGFALAPAPATADPCPAPPFDLLPGQVCSLVLNWPGTSAGAAGGRLNAVADDPWGGAGVEISVSEDPAQRSNVGTGGGAAGALGWWLALCGATAALARRAHRPGRGARPPRETDEAAR